MAGPLSGIKLVELASIGPGPMAAMMLADMGATILRIDRHGDADVGIKRPLRFNLLLRNRKAIALDLKRPEAVEVVLKLLEKADGLIEGFRPGVTERLGLGPDICLSRNPRLVYGRMTGWGQSGPLSQFAAHDLNYIAITGALHAIGRKGSEPAIPLNVVGDYAGGGAYLAFGMVCALLEAQRSGKGQVVDAAIVDGTAHLMTNFHGMLAAGLMTEQRGSNVLDSGAFYYDVYQCADGGWISIAPIEPKFYAQLLSALELSIDDLPPQSDRERWPEGRAILARKFLTRSRAEWCAILERTDCCFAPVLTLQESREHVHMQARNTYVNVDGVQQPAPAPRFSRTVPDLPTTPEAPDERDLNDALASWLDAAEISAITGAGLLAKTERTEDT